MITRTLFTLLVLGTMLFAPSVNAQRRDHLTPQEVDLVKEAQALDKRIDVFIKAADRRLLVINGGAASAVPNSATAKQLKKDAEKWGELPTGTRAELLTDIARILDEAITNIDDVSARDERNPLIPKALRKLAQSVNTMMEQLKPLRGQAKTDSEIASFESLNEGAQSILDAVVKLPPEVEKKAKAKNK